MNKKVSQATGGEHTLYLSAVKGVLSGLTLTLVLCAAGAWMVLKEYIGERSVAYMPVVIVPLAAYTASTVSRISRGKQVMMASVIASVLYYGVLMILTLLLFRGERLDSTANLLLVLCGTGAAILYGVRNKKGRGRKIFR